MESNWLMKQVWRDLLFIHWPVSAKELQKLLPEPLTIDTFEGKGFISLVPFTMTGIRFKGTPSVPCISQLHELNVRTYVNYQGERGVYFFSLDATNALAVWIARRFFHLPYLHADIMVNKYKDSINFECTRKHKGFQQEEVLLTYKPISAPYHTKEGTVDEWLTNRDRLFTVYKKKVFRGKLFHDPWILQDGHYFMRKNTLTTAYPPINKSETIVHYAQHLVTYFYPFQKM
ncbi:YqjF family protein [Priestia flexa]